MIIFAVLLELSVIVFGALTLNHSRSQYEARAAVNTENLAKLLSQDLASSFDKIDLTLRSIKDEAERQIAAGGIEKSSLDAFIKRHSLLHDDLNFAGVTDPGGVALYGTGVLETGISPALGGREYFIRLRNETESVLVVSKPLISKINGLWAIAFARRVNQPNGAFAGIAYMSVTLRHFQKLFSTLNLGPNGVVNLRDLDLATVVRYPDTILRTSTGNKTVSKEWQEKLKMHPESGTYFAVGLDNRLRVLTYYKIGNYPFYIIAGHDPSDFLDGWNQEARNTLALSTVLALAILAFVGVIIRAWKRIEADAARMAQLSHRLVEVQESERRELARELHDVASPNLAALQISLKVIQAELPAAVNERLQSRFAEVRSMLGEVTTNLRDVCANLRPTMLDYSGLLPALDDYAKNFSRGTSIQVKVTGSASDARLAPDIESLLFRIAQEAVTNAAKHAQTGSIEIELKREAGRTRLTIQDRGIGFDLAGIGKSGRPGLGLLTMQERAEFMGGRFTLSSSPDHGTCILVEI